MLAVADASSSSAVSRVTAAASRRAPGERRVVRPATGRVAGGVNVSALRFVELFDPGSGRWSLTGSMTNAHSGVAVLLQVGRVLVADSDVGDVYSPATGTWSATGPMVYPYPYASGAALLPNGQVLFAGGRKVKYCGQYSCDEPIADAELYTP